MPAPDDPLRELLRLYERCSAGSTVAEVDRRLERGDRALQALRA
jgi:hypothetical protein